jgi:hypothetical protein
VQDDPRRRRLETRLSKLPKLYSWGDLTDEAYRREMAETRTMLAELPDPNKLVAFDRNRRVMVTMAEKPGAGGPAAARRSCSAPR